MKNKLMSIVARTGRGLLPLCAMAMAFSAKAQPVSTYTFSSFTGTYAPITGGTVLNTSIPDSWVSTAITLTPGFNFCGTVHTTAFITSNGLLTLGGAAPSSTQYNAIANNTGSGNALCVFNSDMTGSTMTGAAPNMRYELVGDEHVFQWQDASRFGSAVTPNERINLQVRLNHVTGVIRYVYGIPSVATATTYQPVVGIRTANTAGNWQSRNVTTAGTDTWQASLNAATTADNLRFTSATTNPKQPVVGLTYQYKPLPPIDMKADSIFTAVTPFCSNSTQQVWARLTNAGTADINDVTVHWSVDGVLQTPVTYSTAPITNVSTAPANTVNVALGGVYFADSNPVTIKAWTFEPNTLPDEEPANDTTVLALTATLPGVDVVLPADTTICNGESIVIDGGSFANNPIYVWNNGQLTQTLAVSASGTYILKVQNDVGCFDRDTMSVTMLPDPVANSIAIIDNGDCAFTLDVIGAQNVDSYSWDFGIGNPVPGPGPKNFSYPANGSYTVTLTMSNECGTIVIDREVFCQKTATGIDNISGLSAALNMYPNPARDKVIIGHTGNFKIKEMALFNLLGQEVYRAKRIDERQEINVSNLPAGIYHLIVDTDQGRATKKLEIIR